MILCKYLCFLYSSQRLRWSRGSVLAFSTPSSRVFKGGVLRAKKFLSTPSFGGEVKPSVPCRRFAACKWRGSRHFGKITGQHSRPQFPLPPLGFLMSWRTMRHLVAKVGTSKRGGKQWQTTPKNLPSMQRTRAIPVAWLSSGLCPDRPKGWISIIIMWVQQNGRSPSSAMLRRVYFLVSYRRFGTPYRSREVSD